MLADAIKKKKIDGYLTADWAMFMQHLVNCIV